MNHYSEYTAPQTSVSEQMVTVSDGSSIRIIDFDPGGESRERPIVVFVAGWISMISGWKGVLKEITPCFRTLYVETREKSSSYVAGQGKFSFTMSRLTQDLEDLIDEYIEHDREFVFAGSSLGATAIIEYCSGSARNPVCAVLISPNAQFHFPKLLGPVIPFIPPLLYMIVKPFIKWYLRNFMVDSKNEPEQIQKYEKTLDYADPRKLKANAVALMKYSVKDKLPLVKSPCLIIGASSDTLHGADGVRAIADAIPGSEYIEMSSNRETHSEAAGSAIVRYISSAANKKK